MFDRYASKYRAETQHIISKTQDGPLRIEWVAQGKALALFSVRERRAILQYCAQGMGEYWISTWLPKRFTDYAKVLGYHAGMKYQKSKRKQFGAAIPLVYSGSLRSYCLEGARSKGQAGTDKGPSCLITIPTGTHFIAAIVRSVLSSIPAFEIKAMATQFGSLLRGILNGSITTDPTRSKLSQTQRGVVGLSTRRRGKLAA